ncbi:MAG: hypothetical protein JSR79_00525 [Proteobacteria bacterium]|nr:hypothetical protein [Pseudomonadota bacterium]
MEVRVLFRAPFPVKTANCGCAGHISFRGSGFEHCRGACDDDLIVVDANVTDQHPHIGAPQVGVLAQDLDAQHVAKTFDSGIVDDPRAGPHLILEAVLGLGQCGDRGTRFGELVAKDRVARAHQPLFNQFEQTPQPSFGGYAFTADAVEIILAARLGIVRAVKDVSQ